jgi:hypothetical protein
MSPAASPCPDADPAGTPATPTAESQLAGIRELVRIAELQARAYAEDAAAAESAEPAGDDAAPAAPADPGTAGSPPQAPAVPRQAVASDSESSAATKPA